MAPRGGVDSPKNRAATPAILIALHSAFLPLIYRKMCGETMLKRSKPTVPFVPRHRLLGCLLRSGNRLNHHHLPHHAALHRCSLTSELVQFSLVPIKRVDLLPYDPARTSCLSSRTLGCTQLRSCPFPCGERHTWSRWPNGQLRKRFSRRALAKRNGDAAWALIPEVRAGCGKAACPDP